VSAPIRYPLGDLEFTWDLAKSASNIEKHGITFEEAATTWLDASSIECFDEAHSADEDRWLRIGSSLRGALLVVWSTERSKEGRAIIRIIGARRANRRERRLYEQEQEDQDG
jgi:uncharacterized protein